jgi:hypothetical protein
MSKELAGPVRLLVVIAAVAAARFAGQWFPPLQQVAMLASIPLVLVAGVTLVTLFKRLAERRIVQMPSQLMRGACWVAFCVVAVPLALWIAFMACCAPLMLVS